MWLPANSLYATENFSSNETGYNYYSNFSGQNDIGGVVSLRNIATGLTVVVPAGEPWPAMIWNEEHHFNNLWSAYSGHFVTSGQVPIQNLSYGTIGFLGQSTIYEYDSNNTYDLKEGFLVECSFLVNRLTGTVSTGQNFYGIYIDSTGDGYDSVSLSYDPPGFVVGKGLAHETFIPSTGITSQVISFRYGAKGETGHFITADGSNILITGRTPGTSKMATLTGNYGYSGFDNISVLGDITFSGYVDSDARVELGHYHFKSPVSDIAGDFIPDTAYPTGVQTFITREFSPSRDVQKWGGLYAKYVGSTGGSTKIIPLYTTDDWATTGTSSAFISGSATGLMYHNAFLSGITADKVKFKIEQWSDNGTEASPGVDYLTLTYETQDNNSLLIVDPPIGSAAGEYTVLLSIDPGNRDHVTKPTGGTFLINFGSKPYLDQHSELTGTAGRGAESITGLWGGLATRIDGSVIMHNPLTGLFWSADNVVLNPAKNAPLVRTKGYQQLFATGNLTGAPTGTVGYSLSKWSMTGAKTGNSTYYVDTINYFKTGTQQAYIAQNYEGYVGHGWVTPALTGGLVDSDKYVVVEAIVQVEKGGVAFSLNSGTLPSKDIVYTAARCKTPHRVKACFPRNYQTGFTVIAYGTDEDGNFSTTGLCEYAVADVRTYSMLYDTPIEWDSPSISTGHDNYAIDWSMSMWAKPNCLSHTGTLNTAYLFKVSDDSNREMILGLDRFGRPRTTFLNGSPTTVGFDLTGAFGADPDEWTHYSILRRDRFIETYVNGEIASRYSGGFSFRNLTGVSIGRGYVTDVSDFRIQTGTKHPARLAAFDAYSTPPMFQTEYQFQTGDAYFLYRLDQSRTWDATTYKNDLYFPEEHGNRENIVYGVGVFGEGIQLHNRSYGRSLTGVHHTGSEMFLAGYVALPQPVTRASIAAGSNWRVMFSGQYLQFEHGTGLLTSSVEFDIFQYFPFAIDMYSDGADMRAVGYYNTGQSETGDIMFSGALHAGTNVIMSGQITIGHDFSNTNDKGLVFIDELGLFSGSYADKTGSWLLWEEPKEKPGEAVYINGTAVDTGRVRHIGIYDKELVMPPMTSYSATGSQVKLSVQTLQGTMFVSPSFQYAGARKIVLDTGSYELWAESRDRLCKTKSPIRIGARAPENSVNLAFLQSPEFSVPNNLSLVDNAGNISDNFVSSLSSYSAHGVLTGAPATGASYNTYFDLTGEIDTDEVLVTQYTMSRKDVNFAAPLFYKHNLGGDDLFLYQTDATGNYVTGEYIKLIRNNIRVVGQNGDPISIESFPWDIRVSKTRDDGFNLPSNVFNVELLSRDVSLPGDSLFVEYNAADPANRFVQVKGHREALNPEPIWFHTRDAIAIEESYATIDVGRFTNLNGGNVNSGPMLRIYPNNSGWTSQEHRDIKLEDGFLSR